jgi:N utilization substance protein B
VLYAYELSGEPVEQIAGDLLMGKLLDEKNQEFARSLIAKVVEHLDELNDWIIRKSQNWDFHRIAVLDRIILRMGICELLYFPDIPPKVTINEAVELAKKYSTEKSGIFVNGILDAVLRELKETGQLQKTGRGLLEE